MASQTIYTPGNLVITPEVTIEGIVKPLTPIKTSRAGTRYYNFTLVDGSNAVRAVNFDSTNYDELHTVCFNKEPVHLGPVAIKRQRSLDGYEVVLSKRCKITSSMAQFDDNIPDMEESMFKKIEDIINDCKVEDCINVRVKVVKLGEIDEVSKDGQLLKKQSVSVADSSGIMDVMLWQQSVDDLKLNCSYKLIGVRVKKSIFLSMSTSTVVQISEDIGNAMLATDIDSVKPHKAAVTVGEIIGCDNVQVYHSCCFCKGRLNTPSNDIATCTSCEATCRVSKCSKEIHCILLLQKKDSDETIKLTAFSKHVLPLLTSVTDASPQMIKQQIVSNDKLVTVEHRNSIICHLDINRQ